MRYAIGIDIGGTQLRIGVIDECGHALALEKGSSFAKDDPSRLIEAIVEAIYSDRIHPHWQNTSLAGIGIGMAGLVNTESGLVHASPHFPQIHSFSFKKTLARTLEKSRALTSPILIDNDANCIAAGEAWHGAGQGWADFMMIAVGTGIGGGFIRGGKVDRGTTGFAGEIGHMCITLNGGFRCPCGSAGCWETVASGSGLPNVVRGCDPTHAWLAVSDTALGESLFSHAQAGDPFALEVYRQLGKNLGIGIASLISITGLHHVVLTGGLQAAKEYFMESLLEALPRSTYTAHYPPAPELRWATHFPWSGVYGAAKLVFENTP